eukprot:TRINITY_DN1056_c0_g1_i1.p1 TRINITY_DN1056_c0_g1~~TRINITY_DN1056_c0_g1_i1.p1  ORF type:complete len:233 (-),score=10.21 TRINITY_DN1056_c0_g1_i1:176-853(-)
MADFACLEWAEDILKVDTVAPSTTSAVLPNYVTRLTDVRHKSALISCLKDLLCDVGEELGSATTVTVQLRALLAESGSGALEPVLRTIRGRVCVHAKHPVDSLLLAAVLGVMNILQMNILLEEVEDRLAALAVHDVGHQFVSSLVLALQTPYQMSLVVRSFASKIRVILAKPQGHKILLLSLHKFPCRLAAPVVGAVLQVAPALGFTPSDAVLYTAFLASGRRVI